LSNGGQIQHGALPGTVANVQVAEAASSMPLGRLFDGFVEHTKRVSPACLVTFERNRYSMPASFANRPVSQRVYPKRIVIAAEGQILCEHDRIIDRSRHQLARTIYNRRHYLAAIQRKPMALCKGVPFAELPEVFRTLLLT
jgi:Mu transposase, C-terminal domain